MFFLYIDRTGAKTAQQIDPSSVVTRLMPFRPPDKHGHFAGRNHLLVQCIHWNTAASKREPVPLFHDETGISTASWARLDNRSELADKLTLDRQELQACSDTDFIVKSYLKWGENCVDHLIGDFVFVIYDQARRTVFCGRDHMGVRPFYYFASDSAFVCATSTAAILHVGGTPAQIDPEWVARYFLHLSMSFDRTAYRNILKLPPAHCLTLTPEHLQIRRYFTLSAEPPLVLKDSRDYVEAYREQLETAITCRLDTDYSVGSELSGGIDSSTITAFAAKQMDLSRFHTFAFAFSQLEPQYILAVSQACHLPYNHVFSGRSADPEYLIPRSLAVLGYPVEHGNATAHEPFYRLAEQFDIRTLLSGFGGDEFGTTIHGYMVPMELLLQRRLKKLLHILPGNPLFRLLRLMKMEYRRMKTHNFTLPEFTPRFYNAFRKRWPHHILREDLVEQYNLENRYFEGARFDAGYTCLKRFTLENRWAPFVPTRMENCSLMAAARKIEYRWPLLDIRLVRLFLAIPSEEQFFRGMGRYLHRRAIDGVVPDRVTWKRSKDMGPVIPADTNQGSYFDGLSTKTLHPEMERYIDMEKFEKQIREMPQILNLKIGDAKRFQYMRNAHAAANIDAWLKCMDQANRT